MNVVLAQKHTQQNQAPTENVPENGVRVYALLYMGQAGGKSIDTPQPYPLGILLGDCTGENKEAQH